MSDDQAGHGTGGSADGDAAATDAAELARSDREWAAQATPAPAAVPPAHVPVGGGGGGGASRPDAARRGPRPVRGPSGNAMVWLRGLGLLSVLAAVAIMALLSWKILSDTGGDDVEVVTSAPPTDAPLTDAPPTNDAPANDPTGGVQLGGRSDAAAAQACETARRTVEVAATAYEIERGSRPVDVQAIVDAGYLKQDLDLEVAIAPDGSVVLTGTCAEG